MSTNCCGKAVMNTDLFSKSSCYAQTMFSGASSIPTPLTVLMTSGGCQCGKYFTPIYTDNCSCFTNMLGSIGGGCCSNGYSIATFGIGPQSYTAKDSIMAIKSWDGDIGWGEMINGTAKQGAANAISSVASNPNNWAGLLKGALNIGQNLLGGASSFLKGLFS